MPSNTLTTSSIKLNLSSGFCEYFHDYIGKILRYTLSHEVRGLICSIDLGYRCNYNNGKNVHDIIANNI